MKLTVNKLRMIVKQLETVSVKGDIKLPLRDDIRLTVSGVVVIPGIGWMHPMTFRDIAGDEAYQELLRRPRVVTKYDEESQ